MERREGDTLAEHGSDHLVTNLWQGSRGQQEEGGVTLAPPATLVITGQLSDIPAWCPLPYHWSQETPISSPPLSSTLIYNNQPEKGLRIHSSLVKE